MFTELYNIRSLLRGRGAKQSGEGTAGFYIPKIFLR
jgi:hypothetical protein